MPSERLTQHTAYFTLTGTNVAPPWTNYAVVATNFAKPNGNFSTAAILTYHAVPMATVCQTSGRQTTSGSQGPTPATTATATG